MYQFLDEKIEKMEDINMKISKLLSDIKNTPESLLPSRVEWQNDKLHSLIIELYSYLSSYHRDEANLYGISKAFPPAASELTEIQEINSDYIRIKMPMMYRKDKGDYILAYDLDRALSEAQKNGTPIPYMEKMEIVFTFNYSSETDKSLIRDNDNYAIKPIINTIVRHMRGSDRGDKAWLSLRTIVKENIENHTIIEIRRHI